MFRTRTAASTALHLAAPAVALALLAGCGTPHSTPGPAPSADNPTVAAAPSMAPTEGPASTAHTWPDGITAQVTKVELGNRAASYGLTANEDPIKVTVTVRNAGTQPFPLVYTWHWVVVYGPNNMVADRILDAAGDTGRTQSVDPEQVGPGQTVVLFDTAAVPHDQLGRLAVQTDLDPSERTVTAYTFTGAESLLK